MICSNSHPFRSIDAQRIMDDLSTRQHLVPHASLGTALAASGDALGFNGEVALEAVSWLGFDDSRAVGRLRRSELAQLAQSIDRFLSQPASDHQSARLA